MNRRSPRSKRNAPGASGQPNKAAWTALEQAFFDSAPPDQPEPAADPECFDDLELLESPRRRGQWLGALLPALAAAFAALRRLVFGPTPRSGRASPL